MRWAVLCGALCLAASDVRAEETASPDEDRAAQARQLYEQGVAAMSEAQWARAETLFEQAYELKRHYQIAGNLGTCELELGKHAEAASHLHDAWTEIGDDPTHSRERLALKKLLTTARAQCGALEIRIEPTGQQDLEVEIDGRRLDWPRRLVFVSPGHHQIVASHDPSGRRAELAVDVERGVTRKLALVLDGSPAAPPPPGPDEPAATGLPSYPIWIGIGATVAAAGAGIALQVVGGGSESDADQLRDDLRAGQASCSAGCPELLDRYADADGAYDASTGLFIAAGALAAATVGYAVLTFAAEGDEPVVSASLSAGLVGGTIGLTVNFQ